MFGGDKLLLLLQWKLTEISLQRSVYRLSVNLSPPMKTFRERLEKWEINFITYTNFNVMKPKEAKALEYVLTGCYSL